MDQPVGTPPVAQAQAVPWDDEPKVKAAVEDLLQQVCAETVTVRKFRRQVASHLGLGKKGLEDKAEEVNAIIKEALSKHSEGETSAQMIARTVECLGPEDTQAKQMVYLLTISRVLPGTLAITDLKDITKMSREDIAGCVRKAFDEPLPPEAGQPGRRRQRTEGIVRKLVVFLEIHADGEIHFHVAVLLSGPFAWGPAKRTLRVRDGIPCHVSCSHTQLWSTIRYCFVPTLKKPNVDGSPWLWSEDGSWPAGLAAPNTTAWSCLFEASQRPWNAYAWKARHEQVQLQKEAGQTSSKNEARFRKLDLTAIILDKDFKTPASIMEYTQQHGTASMQVWVHQNQRKLKEFLADAIEWGEARKTAEGERQSDWELICQTASKVCPLGDACPYARAASQFFKANSSTLSRTRLAAALRDIIVAGPSKTRRTPMIVGPSNTGKSTMVAPFDDVFGKKNVLHKPALKSNYALRNILNNKKFLYWDDFRPVTFAQATVEVSTILSLFNGFPFEVQVSQSFNDGNIDFEWRRGAVVTAPLEGLWDAWGEVTAEDVRHMRNRFEEFPCYAKIEKLQDSGSCAIHMCNWIVAGAAEADAQPALQAMVLPVTAESGVAGDQDDGELAGMSALVGAAKIPVAKAAKLQEEILACGAVHVQELSADDWKGLAAWSLLKPFEQRRVLAQLQS